MSDESDELVQALRDAAMGDENQIWRVAEYLRGIESNATQQAGQSAVQRELEQLKGQRQYLKKVLQWSRNNPDIAFSDEDYLHAVEVDARLAKAYPDMSEEDRLERAAEITRMALGDAETRDHESAIAQMRGRGKEAVRHEPVRYRERDPEEIERSEAIEELRKGRMPHNNDAAGRAQERAARDPQRARMHRAVDFPTR
jgi:hypothetical protein